MTSASGFRLKVVLLAGGMLLSCLHPSPALAGGYGSLAGVVSDNKGIPLMGATVVLVGPLAFATEASSEVVEHMITDAHGRFTIAHLIPGWYSLKVSSPTRLPVMRNGVHVEAGETVVASFVLTDTFAPIRFQVPNNSISSWGDDWKWVLRTSSTTRPILRFHAEAPSAEVASKEQKPALPASERFAGVLPGSTPADPLAENFGMASMFAYLQSISPDADILAEGSFAASDANAGTVGTLLSRNVIKGQPEQMGLAFHQFSLAPDASVVPGASAIGQTRAMAATYSETRLLAPKVTVTAGMDVDFLNSFENVLIAQPHVNLEYQATAQTVVSLQYGSARPDGFSTGMIERLTLLNSFPQITERNGHLEMVQLNHGEVALNHRVGKNARVQAAAYHDNVHNAAIWALGRYGSSAQFAGNALPNPVGGGMVINGGNYQSSGFRAVYARTFGSRLEVMGAYETGAALSAQGYNGSARYSQNFLTPRQTNALAGKITADLPGSRTRVSASYEWLPSEFVTMVDPAGQGNLQLQPYLGVEIRQPIPTPNFLPVHIDAVADFQNLLSQGYGVNARGGDKPVVLSSGYHSVSGGFSVQF